MIELRKDPYRTLNDIEYDVWSAKRLGMSELETVFRNELQAWWRGQEPPDTTTAQLYISKVRMDGTR